jgi:putative ABC transport system permease protein
MFRNYLKLAWRNLKKNKVFSFINIFGLSVGLTCCLLISLYLYHEFSYDGYHANADRVYQLGTNFIEEGESKKKANTAGPLAGMMQADFPEIAAAARVMRLFRDDKTLLQVKQVGGEQRSFYETGGTWQTQVCFRYLASILKKVILPLPWKDPGLLLYRKR